MRLNEWAPSKDINSENGSEIVYCPIWMRNVGGKRRVTNVHAKDVPRHMVPWVFIDVET